MNKERFSGANGPADRQSSLSVLYEVLLTLCKTMAPLTPFFVELQYQNLRLALPEKERFQSVHFDFIPEVLRGDPPLSCPAHARPPLPRCRLRGRPRFLRGAPCQ